ncbi:16S rRNA (guanine527-N7)-methyltransferase [Lachnospiraceae bacterium NE2001]|nr:16S rRNA (guanine527-N7)-methyltransferase [Lachnospiraceae bacterium NE2001]
MKDTKYYADLLGIELSGEQLEQFSTYMNMVIEKNQVMNLTAITDPEEFALKHFADSLSLIPALAETDILSSKNVSMIDVGTGAGFPSIPLKIARPNIQLTLLDSLNKRIKFLDDVITALYLNGITTVHSRAEEGGRMKDLRDNFDIAVSRAVANLSVLTEYCLPYVKVGGLFISYKSQDIDEELASSKRAIKLLGGELEDVINFQLADSDISRSFVLIRKTKATPKAYPRKPGTAKKDPL